MSNNETIRQAVRDSYAKVALEDDAAGCGTNCCNTVNANASTMAKEMGYSSEDVKNVPQGANLGLGCGNPGAIAQLRPGETVLDLGSGAGFDCFLAVAAVGATGFVIGVDMTHEMLAKARRNAAKQHYENVEFRLGEIEHLPVADNSIDVIISNCVINLSPEKEQVFKEAYRVLKQGGRLAISDVVTSIELPQDVLDDMAKYTACISGAWSIDMLEQTLNTLGFKDISIKPKAESKQFIKKWADDIPLEDYIVSASIEAVK